MHLDLHRETIEADAAELRARTVGADDLAVGASAGLDEREPFVHLRVEDTVIVFSWGKPHQLGTACYWVEQTRRAQRSANHQLGQSLHEEVAVCLLGGHGVRASVGIAAFEAVRTAGLLEAGASPRAAEIEAILARPLEGPSQRPVRYRFPRQRAIRLARCLEILEREEAPVEPLALRDWLLDFPGVGPKTAAWIARNYTGTDDVAIIDIHVRRAGLAAGFFLSRWRLPGDYSAFELAFVAVARLGSVSAAALDAYIWDELQYLGNAGVAVLGREIATFR
jgi:N-glycosylase/DNA lyase